MRFLYLILGLASIGGASKSFSRPDARSLCFFEDSRDHVSRDVTATLTRGSAGSRCVFGRMVMFRRRPLGMMAARLSGPVWRAASTNRGETVRWVS